MDLIYRYDPFRPVVVERPQDAQSAVRTLLDGNGRLVGLIRQMQEALTGGHLTATPTVVPVDLVSLGLPFWPGAALDQSPFSLVLGCSDARVPIESIFDQSFNDLFVVRIAGNVLGTECLGSFDYAVRNLGPGLKAVVVLGHTGCGAVSAAVDTYLSPNDYADIAFTHALRSLVDRILIAVRGAAHAFERHGGHRISRNPGYREALIEAAAYLNAALTAFDLRREIVSGEGELAVFYGACDIKTMLVRAVPAAVAEDQPQLHPAPKHADELIALGDLLAQTIAKSGLLK